jgi:predicted enzyme related to lactoylglutathione lyase
MVDRGDHIPRESGTFCWADLRPDIQLRAIQFYGGLANWSATPGPEEFGGYAMATVGPREAENAVAGILGESMAVPGPPAWTPYLATSDIVATERAILEHGGELTIPTIEVPGSGSLLAAKDPTGAEFGVWQGTGHPGFGRYGEPGAFTWAEVFSRDAHAARDFYAEVFDLEWTALSDTPDFTYFTLAVPGEDEPQFGVMQIDETFPAGALSHWALYLGVANVDAVAAWTSDHGGVVDREPFDSPFGRIAHIRDSEGVALSLIDTTTPVGSRPDEPSMN